MTTPPAAFAQFGYTLALAERTLTAALRQHLAARNVKPETWYALRLIAAGSPGLAREALNGLASLHPVQGDGQVVVPLESGLGVWIVPVLVNGHRGRFLLDTGASVVVVGPALAAAAGLKPVPGREGIELQTLGGRTRGPSAVVESLEVGNAVLRDVPVVLHEPGPGVDGILGNTFLSHYQVTLDADRRQLALRLPGVSAE